MFALKKSNVQLSTFCGWKVYQRLQPIRDFQHNTGTVFYCDGVWIEKLKNGCTSFAYEEGARCPTTATNEDNIERAHDMVLRQVTFTEVAGCLQINHGSAYEIIHNRYGFHKVCAR
jgi:hypothetical protein